MHGEDDIGDELEDTIIQPRIQSIRVTIMAYPIPDGIESICESYPERKIFNQMLNKLRKIAFGLKLGFCYATKLVKRANEIELKPLNEQISRLSEQYRNSRIMFAGFHGRDVECRVPRNALDSDKVLDDLVQACPNRIHFDFRSDARGDDIVVPAGLDTRYFPEVSDICVYDPVPNDDEEEVFNPIRSSNALSSYAPHYPLPPFLQSNSQSNGILPHMLATFSRSTLDN